MDTLKLIVLIVIYAALFFAAIIVAIQSEISEASNLRVDKE